MNSSHTKLARLWQVLRISLPTALVLILFFTGAWQLEEAMKRSQGASLGAAVVAAEVVSLTNGNRTADGLPALNVSPLLTQAAQLKADDMAAKSYYAHIGPDGKSPLSWLDAVGYKYLNAGENLVIDRDTSQEAVDAWMGSPDHRENILRPQFTDIGVGVSEGEFEGRSTIFVVQEFGTPYPTLPAPRTPIVVPATPSAPATHPTVTTSTTPTAANTKTSTQVAPTVVATSTNTSATSTPVVVAPQPKAPVIVTVPKLVKPLVQPILAALTQSRVATASTSIVATSTASTTPELVTEATTTITVATSSLPTVALILPPEFFSAVRVPMNAIASTLSTTSSVTTPEMHQLPAWIEQGIARIRAFFTQVPRLWS